MTAQALSDSGELVYLAHMSRAMGDTDNPHGWAQHYIGTARDLAARLAEHGTSSGARILQAARQQGITWEVVRTWPGGRARERELKARKEGPRLCPKCTPHPKPARARTPSPQPARAARQARPGGARHVPAAPRPAVDPAERGARSAARFLAEREGWSADRIAATHEFITGPARENGHRTPAAAAEMAAFSTHVSAALEQLRATEREQAAPAAQPQREGTEVSTDTAAGPAAQPATEWIKGAQTAHDLITRQAEAGHSADHIAAQWEGALATYDDEKATPEQREWHAGAKETAADMTQTLREMARAEAEQAQADRDARAAEPEPELEAEAG